MRIIANYCAMHKYSFRVAVHFMHTKHFLQYLKVDYLICTQKKLQNYFPNTM